MYESRRNLLACFLTLIFWAVFAVWFKSFEIELSWQRAGWINFSLGFLLLVAYLSSQIVKIGRLPLISGYIIAGIIAGPSVSNFLTDEMLNRLRLIDDVALSTIALTAGGALHLQILKQRIKPIILNIVLITLIVFGLVFMFVVATGNHFTFTRQLSSAQVIALAIFVGIIAVARSPSSAIAIITECRASGPFTETVLSITIAMDVLIIILFTAALSVTQIIFNSGGMAANPVIAALTLEVATSLLIGAVLGKGVSFYIQRVGYDLTLVLLFIAFGVAKVSTWLGYFMENQFSISLHLEPLLICMSMGFVVQNFSKTGPLFMASLDRIALPVYVLFFSLAGAALNFDALLRCWLLTLCISVIRAVGIFAATWLAGTISGHPSRHNRTAWMAFITQAGVAIGLAQITQRQFPEIGMYLTTVVLAMIAINQIVGPVTFKMALNLLGEAKRP
jgi:Kef-type K+ transport system membrane component KefB